MGNAYAIPVTQENAAKKVNDYKFIKKINSIKLINSNKFRYKRM